MLFEAWKMQSWLVASEMPFLASGNFCQSLACQLCQKDSHPRLGWTQARMHWQAEASLLNDNISSQTFEKTLPCYLIVAVQASYHKELLQDKEVSHASATWNLIQGKSAGSLHFLRVFYSQD